MLAASPASSVPSRSVITGKNILSATVCPGDGLGTFISSVEAMREWQVMEFTETLLSA
jgi:hypothetical protein